MNEAQRRKHRANEEQKRRQQMENLRALAERKGATEKNKQDYLNADAGIKNAPKLIERKKAEAEEEARKDFPGGEFRLKFKEDILPTIKLISGDYSSLQNFGADESGLHGYAEGKADEGNAPKRNEGFINLYSRNFRRVIGEAEGDEPDAGKVAPWAFATGQLSPYIDAKADEELQDGGEPGFWNMYSGLHNLVGREVLGAYGVYGG